MDVNEIKLEEETALLISDMPNNKQTDEDNVLAANPVYDESTIEGLNIDKDVLERTALLYRDQTDEAPYTPGEENPEAMTQQSQEPGASGPDMQSSMPGYPQRKRTADMEWNIEEAFFEFHEEMMAREAARRCQVRELRRVHVLNEDILDQQVMEKTLLFVKENQRILTLKLEYLKNVLKESMNNKMI